MELSVIIPVYNRATIISKVIDRVMDSSFKAYEIIIVDDGSTDTTPMLTSLLGVKTVRLEKNSGAAVARNAGAKVAEGDILVFVDSDVFIKKDTLQRIHEHFHTIPWLASVVGTPATDNQCRGLCSRHFNWRVCFNFSLLPDWIDICWGSLMAVRKQAFNVIGGFDETLKKAGIEDNEFGYRLSEVGTIYHDKTLQVVHHKVIGFLALMRNDFKRTVDRVNLLISRKKTMDILKKKRFISTPIDQLAAPFVAFLCLINPSFLWLFLLTQIRYLNFMRHNGDLLFGIVLLPVIFIDMLVVFSALCFGVLKRCLY